MCVTYMVFAFVLGLKVHNLGCDNYKYSVLTEKYLLIVKILVSVTDLFVTELYTFVSANSFVVRQTCVFTRCGVVPFWDTFSARHICVMSHLGAFDRKRLFSNESWIIMKMAQKLYTLNSSHIYERQGRGKGRGIGCNTTTRLETDPETTNAIFTEK